MQRLVGVFARGGVGLAAAAQFFDGGGEGIGRETGIFEQARGGAVGGEEGEQQGLESDKLVAVTAGDILGGGERGVGIAIQIGFAAFHAGQTLEFAVDGAREEIGVHTGFSEEKLRDVFSHGEDALQKVGGRDGLTLRALRRLHSVLHCLLGFDGEVVEVHIFMLFIVVRK